MKICASELNELPAINDLISRSKSFWSYDEDYLRQAIPIIQVTEQWLKDHEGYSIYLEELVGFMGLEIEGENVTLRHLWIHPDMVRKGFGTKIVNYLRELSRERGFQSIRFISEPPAEGFYRKLGAEFTGEVVPSKVKGGPLFH